MINIPVDEGHAFDFLSILAIKAESSEDPKNDEYLKIVRKTLIQQLGIGHFAEVINSDAYQKLKLKNQIIFNLIDEIRYNEHNISAKEIDDANMERFRAKSELQKQFFNANLLEQKT